MKRNAIRIATGLHVVLAVAAMTGCAGSTKPARVAPIQPSPLNAVAQPPAKVEVPVLEGKVQETMSVGSYTYILLEKEGRSTWTAVPLMGVEVGEEITLIPGIDMVNFKSTSLGRTFPYIHFSAGVKGGKPYEIPKQQDPHAANAMPASHPALAKAEPADDKPKYQPVLSGSVVESMDSNGYTYVCIEKDGKKTWAAIPATKLKTGSDLTIYPGNIMPSFTSKSLNRTFENIVFSRGAILPEEE